MDSFDRWCKTVTDYVRYLPDREDIARELRDHYEDHRQALLDLGYEEELASERALSAMGNAEEVGQAMNQVHSPLWGWLWSLSRLCLRLALLIFLLGMASHLIHSGDQSIAFRTRNQFQVFAPTESAVSVQVPHARVTLDPANPNCLLLTIEQDSHLGWGPALEEIVTIWDNQGQLPNGEPSLDTEPRWPGGEGAVLLLNNSPSWGTYQYYLEIHRNIPPKWVEVRHPAGWSIHLDLEEAAE